MKQIWPWKLCPKMISLEQCIYSSASYFGKHVETNMVQREKKTLSYKGKSSTVSEVLAV